MRNALALLLATVVILAPALADARDKQRRQSHPLNSQEAILKFIDGYRRNPEPGRLPDVVTAMRQLGLMRDVEQSGIYLGFVAGVLASNPEQADKLVAAMFPMPPEDQVIVIKAIAYSDLPDWKTRLERFVERMPARRVLIEKYLYDKLPTLANLPLDQSAAVDANWGYYFASSRPEPIRRLLTALAWSTDRNEVEKLTIGSMVKWTLAQNSARDFELLDVLKQELPSQTAAVGEPLREVIEAAETYEMASIRKQAMASIEELKVKGPQKNRDFNWWGQAGQTVFALGCIAAGVTGHVEVGIPCVVGGALSSAALKYLGPQ